jgi:hypothetical protein
MEHFTAEEWIDLVNQVASSSRKLAMEKHQKDGCERCAKTLARWRRVRQAVAAEASYQPAQEAVRIAKAAFAGSEWAWERKAARRVIEVLFDSFLQPAREGLRSVGTGTRRLLYRADPFRIDLQIEARVGGRSIIVTGQLLDLRHPESLGRDVPFMLSNLRGRVVQATTDQFGEFREEIENSGDLELVFHGANEKPMMVSVQDVLGQSLNLKE